MKFKSVNEFDQFSFRDCQIGSFRVTEDCITLELEALIVLPSNSQNRNYTESYAGTTRLRLTAGKLLSGVKEGFRYFDADGRLLRETPDAPLDAAALQELPARCEGAFLFALTPAAPQHAPSLLTLAIELPPAEPYDTLPTDSYLLTTSFEKAIFEWDHYMNRVQEL